MFMKVQRLVLDWISSFRHHLSQWRHFQSIRYFVFPVHPNIISGKSVIPRYPGIISCLSSTFEHPVNPLFILYIWYIQISCISKHHILNIKYIQIIHYILISFLPQAKERWSMYQLKAHFMPQLYWFGLIKVKLIQFFKTSFFLNDFSNLAKKYFQPGNKFYLMQLINATGLVGRARHLQEGAPLWNEIRISDFSPNKKFASRIMMRATIQSNSCFVDIKTILFMPLVLCGHKWTFWSSEVLSEMYFHERQIYINCKSIFCLICCKYFIQITVAVNL